MKNNEIKENVGMANWSQIKLGQDVEKISVQQIAIKGTSQVNILFVCNMQI